MSEHPIEGLMITAMNSIKDMVDVNTIIGETIHTENAVIIPISKVSFGFAAGGSEFKGETIDEYTKKEKEEEIQYRLPFGGGSGAGVNINPIAFLVVQENHVKLLPVNHTSCLDKLLDYMPEVVEKANQMLNQMMQKKNECEQKDGKEGNKQKTEKEKKQNKKIDVDIEVKTKPKRKENPSVVTDYEFEIKEQNQDNEEFPKVEYENFEEQDD